MKALFSVSVFLSFVIIILGHPLLNESEFVSEDDVLKANIAKHFRTLERLSGDNNEIPVAIINSIDQNCMLDKYNKNNLESQVTEEALDLLNIDGRPLDPIFIFANIALTCSNKLHKLLEFVFDNIFSYSSLLDAFREDEPFKDFIDDLVCYNKYAVKEKLLDPNAYPHLVYTLESLNKTEAECEESLKDTREALVETLDYFSEMITVNEAKCIQGAIATEAEKFFFKYVLLIPLGLSDDEKKQQKSNFIADALSGMQVLLACNIKKEDQRNNEIPS